MLMVIYGPSVNWTLNQASTGRDTINRDPVGQRPKLTPHMAPTARMADLVGVPEKPMNWVKVRPHLSEIYIRNLAD